MSFINQGALTLGLVLLALSTSGFASNTETTQGGGGSSHTFITVNQPPEGDKPSAVQFTPDGQFFIVAHLGSKNLMVFDAATREIVRIIQLSGSPQDMAITSDGIHAVTANLLEDTVSIVDIAQGQEVATVNVGDEPALVRITSDNTTAVIGNHGDSSLSVIDIASAVELREIPGADIYLWGGWGDNVGLRFAQFEIAPDDTTVVFPDLRGDQIVFFDITVGSSVSASSELFPASVALSRDSTIGVVNHGLGNGVLSVVDTATKSILRAIPLGDVGGLNSYPPIAINDAGTLVLAGEGFGLRIVDLTTDSVSNKITTRPMYDVDFTFDEAYVVVPNATGSIIELPSGNVANNVLDGLTPDLLAISPVEHRAAIVHHNNSEEVAVINTEGALGFLEDTVITGPAPEGDFAARVAISPDGQRAATLNYRSQNTSVIDLSALEVTSMAPLGVTPREIEISPDGLTAVVANLNSNFATIVDLTAGTSTEVGLPSRSNQVEISPDSEYAYVFVFPEGLARIRLDPPTIDGPIIPTANVGSAGELALSHDGATLIVPGPFDDEISIIDTTAWAEVVRLPVGDFSTRAAFSPDDSRIYVINRVDDTVSIVTNAGASSEVISTITVGDFPAYLVVHPDGSRLFVANGGEPTVSIVDLEVPALVDTLSLSGLSSYLRGLEIRPDGRELYIAGSRGKLYVMDTQTNQLIKTIDTGSAITDMAYSSERECLVLAQPEGNDGISLLFPSEYLFEADFE